jgi:hypothetical protein
MEGVDAGQPRTIGAHVVGATAAGVLTGSMVVLNAVQGEMQRPKQVLGGVLGRLTGG